MGRFFRFLAGVLVVALAAAVAGGYLLRDRLQQPFLGGAPGERFVEVPRGAGSGEIGRRLTEAGVVRDWWTFRAALWWTGRARDLKAGEYRFDAPLSPLDVVDKIARGDVYEVRITFQEGLTIDEMAEVYEARQLGTASDFRAAARNATLVSDLDAAARDLEGYLFPETYALSRQATAAALVSRMVERFRAVWTDVTAGHARDALTTRQLVTLASLIEKETARAEERPLVSAVYRNRLKLRMGMQADPTVVYALRKAGRYEGNIRRDDLRIDSPYNTYRYGGLPPGPIAAPGRASLEAALTPANVKFLYFVSRNDGSHAFAETLRQHNANVNRFQVQFFRRQGRR